MMKKAWRPHKYGLVARFWHRHDEWYEIMYSPSQTGNLRFWLNICNEYGQTYSIFFTLEQAMESLKDWIEYREKEIANECICPNCKNVHDRRE
jgi:hypothetical protein